MKGPSLQKATLLSGVLHLMFFLMVLVALRQSGRIVIPSPYIVSLVDPKGVPSASRTLLSEQTREETRVKSKDTEMAQPKEKAKDRTDAKENEKRVEDRITELASLKKIEKIVKLRSIISLKGMEGSGARGSAAKGNPAGSEAGGSSEGTLFDSYYAKITDEIRSEWIYPDTAREDLLAVVYVKIARDGTLTVQGIEKSSGNTLFDRSTLKAIAKATPVSPPPHEMEIGIRFAP